MFHRLRTTINVLFNRKTSHATVTLDNANVFTVVPGGSLQLTSTARMLCPFCRQPMTRSDRKEDWHVDSTGNAQYSCQTSWCEHRPRYRRVDVLETARSAQDRARDEKKAQEYLSYEQMNAERNRLTVWLRARYPGYFRGQFDSVSEIAIYVISKGKEGVIANPLSGQTVDKARGPNELSAAE